MRYIKVKHYKETPDFCGPASLKILLSHYGLEISEKELIRLTEATSRYGTEHEDLVRAARKLGFSVHTKERSTLSDLESTMKKGVPAIIGWFSGDEDHYSVAIGMTGQDVVMADGQWRSPVSKVSRAKFKKLWFDFVGKDNEKICWGWMMTVEPKNKGN